jgi:hypothetical protein
MFIKTIYYLVDRVSQAKLQQLILTKEEVFMLFEA